MADEKQIVVFTEGGDAFGLLDEQRAPRLPVDALRRNLADFMESLTLVLPEVDKPQAGLGLTSVTVAVGVNGEGQVGLWGTGVKLGGTATLTLTFSRG